MSARSRTSPATTRNSPRPARITERTPLSIWLTRPSCSRIRAPTSREAGSPGVRQRHQAAPSAASPRTTTPSPSTSSSCPEWDHSRDPGHDLSAGAAEVALGQCVVVDVSTSRVRGVRSFATPYTKRVPMVDVLVVARDQVEIRPIFGRSRAYSRSEVRLVAAVSYRVLPGVRRRCLKLTFTTERALPLFFRTLRIGRLEQALSDAGWKLVPGDPV
jgi:hypothetical protein